MNTNIIESLYEQEIMAQHINYFILESNYTTLLEADGNKSFKEKIKDLIHKVVEAVKKFFTETLPKAYQFITMQMSKLNPIGKRTTVDPKEIVKQYENWIDMFNKYADYLADLTKELTSTTNRDFDSILSKYKSDIDEYKQKNKILTADEVDKKDKKNHSAQELVYVINSINKNKNIVNSALKEINKIEDQIKSDISDPKMYSLLSWICNGYSSSVRELNALLRLLVRDCNGFKNAYAFQTVS